MIKAIVRGNLGRDPEFKVGASGKEFSCFSLAVNFSKKHREENVPATWVNCISFDTTANEMLKNYKKGQYIEGEGYLTLGEYQGKPSLSLNVQAVQKIEFKPKSPIVEPADQVAPPAAKKDAAFVEDDIPF